MPKLSVYFIRAALFYLLGGFTMGALLLIQKGLPFAAEIWLLRPLHIEAVIFGWMLQLVMGVAFWMMPRFAEAPFRGDERPAWLAFGCLNLGIWANLASFLVPGAELLGLAGRALEVLAIVLFARHLWPRIKPFAELKKLPDEHRARQRAGPGRE